MSNLKITGAETALIALPVEEPLANMADPAGGVRPAITLRLQTDQGVEGIGVTFLGAGLASTLHRAVGQLAEMTVGLDPLDRGAIVAHLTARAGGAGPAGIFTLALSAVEIALWDIAGKARGEPLWKMLGATGAPVPTYASGAMMRHLSTEDAVTAARHLAASGFRAMKFHLALLGETSPALECDRAFSIRAAVGDEIELMCDVNQRWSAEEAMRMGPMIEEIGLAWLEDPIYHEDIDGLCALADLLKTPIAAGEAVYGKWPFIHGLKRGFPDIVMIDPFRAGGIGPWLDIAELARRHGREVVSHLSPEIQVHLIAAIPNGRTVEYMPWLNRLYQEMPWPEQGMLALPQGPGLGVAFDRTACARFTVETATI